MRTWIGTPPENCDICGCPIVEEFTDGVLRSGRSWAIMCTPCHRKNGIGLGQGYGQKYRHQTIEGLELWPKVAG